jgi:hypothetical protein
LDIATDDERALIHAAKHAIKLGKFQGLQREVNKLQRSQRRVRTSPAQLLEKLIMIAAKYPMDVQDREGNAPLVSMRSAEAFLPDIIISESFIGGRPS